MRTTLLILTIGLFAISGCQNSKDSNADNEVTVDSLITRKSDTLLIRDMEKISDPFSFGDKPLQHLLKSTNEKPSMLEISEYADSISNDKGELVKRIIGLIYRIKYGEDYFQMYKRADSVEYFVNTELTTNKFPNKWDIKIGMTKEEVIKRLNQFKIDSIPTTLIIGDLDFTFIQFDFEKDRLKKITYDFYVD